MNFYKSKISFLKIISLISFLILSIILVFYTAFLNKENTVYADVGKTTLTQNGGTWDKQNNVYTGGSGAYLSMSETAPLSTADSWEIKVKYKFQGGGLHNVIFGMSQNSNYVTPVLQYYDGSDVEFLVSTNGLSWDYVLSNSSVLGNLSLGLTYYFKVGFTGYSYYFYYNTTGSDIYHLVSSVFTTAKTYCNLPFMFMNSGLSLDSRYSIGDLFLNDCSIIINNKIWWTGEYLNTSVHSATSSIELANTGNYSLTNVDSIRYRSHLQVKWSFKPQSSITLFGFHDNISSWSYSDLNSLKLSFYPTNDVFSSSDLVNFTWCDLTILGAGTFSISNLPVTPGYYHVVSFKANVEYTLFFDFYGEFNNMIGSDTEDLSSLVDMRVNSNDLKLFDYSYLFNYAMGFKDFSVNRSDAFLFNDYFKYRSSVIISSSSGNSFNLGSTANLIPVASENSYMVFYENTNLKNWVTMSTSFCYDYINVNIEADSFLVNNALVVYNYDSTYSSGITNLVYQTQKGDMLYDICDFSSDNLLNDTFSYFYAQDLQNYLFDKYIQLTMYGSPILNTPFDWSVTDTDTSGLKFYSGSLGLDFNFQKYVQPFSVGDNVYNYSYDKPEMVAMPFSLVPFYLPVNEMVYNAFIFIVFYFPLISDVLAWIHFDMFFGSVLNLYDLFVALNIGSFLLALIMFLILYSIMKSLMPAMYDSWHSTVNSEVEFRENIRREKRKKKKEDRAKIRDSIKRAKEQSRMNSVSSLMKSKHTAFRSKHPLKPFSSSIKHISSSSGKRYSRVGSSRSTRIVNSMNKSFKQLRKK